MRGERRFTRLGDARIHSVHDGAGEDVVLLHGLSGSRHWWRFTQPALARDYRVHVPELIGFGRSRAGWRQPQLTEMAALLAAWLRELGIARPHVVGHSMGGQVAIHLAASGEVALRTLTLVSATGVPRGGPVREGARLLSSALPPRRWGATGFMPTIALDALLTGPRRLAQAGWYLLADDVRPLLARIDVPALLIWGALDPLVPLAHAEQLVAGLPHARLVVLAEAAHNPMADLPAEFNRVLLDFLDRH